MRLAGVLGIDDADDALPLVLLAKLFAAAVSIKINKKCHSKFCSHLNHYKVLSYPFLVADDKEWCPWLRRLFVVAYLLMQE